MTVIINLELSTITSDVEVHVDEAEAAFALYRCCLQKLSLDGCPYIKADVTPRSLPTTTLLALTQTPEHRLYPTHILYCQINRRWSIDISP